MAPACTYGPYSLASGPLGFIANLVQEQTGSALTLLCKISKVNLTLSCSVITVTLTLGIGTLRNCLETGHITLVYLEMAETPRRNVYPFIECTLML